MTNVYPPKCNVVRLFFCGLIFAACLFVSCGPLLDFPAPDPEPLPDTRKPSLVVVPLRQNFGELGDIFDPSYDPPAPDNKQLAVYLKSANGDMTRLKTGEFSVTLAPETSPQATIVPPRTFHAGDVPSTMQSIRFVVNVTSGALEGSPYYITVLRGVGPQSTMTDILIVVPNKTTYYPNYIPQGQTEAIDRDYDISVFFFDIGGVLTRLPHSDFTLVPEDYAGGKFTDTGTKQVTVTYDPPLPDAPFSTVYSVEVTSRQALAPPSLTLDFPLPGQPITRGHVQTGYRINPPSSNLEQPTEYEIWYLEGDANVDNIINQTPAHGMPILIPGSSLRMQGLLENIYGQWDGSGNGIFTGRDIYFVAVGKKTGYEKGVSAPVRWTPRPANEIWLNERMPPTDTGYWTFRYNSFPYTFFVNYLDNPNNLPCHPHAPGDPTNLRRLDYSSFKYTMMKYIDGRPDVIVGDAADDDREVHPEGIYGPAGIYTVESSGVTITGKTFGKTVCVPTGADVAIILNGAEINSLGERKDSPLQIGDRGTGASADVTIELRGDNVLKRHRNSIGDEYANDKAALEVNFNSSVTIRGQGEYSSLTAIGGSRSAGIGGSADTAGGAENCGAITIEEGSIYAFGGTGASGIGIGAVSAANSRAITISGGTVYAFGGPAAPPTIDGGAGISGMEGITITNGAVYAFGGRDSAGIKGDAATVGTDAAVFAFAGIGAVQSIQTSTLTHSGGLLFKDTEGTLKGTDTGTAIVHPRSGLPTSGLVRLNHNIFIPPSTAADFWRHTLNDRGTVRNVFSAAARAELSFRTSGDCGILGIADDSDFKAAYPYLDDSKWNGSVFHNWQFPVYAPPNAGAYTLDLKGAVLDLRGKIIDIVPGGALEFQDSERPSKTDDATARTAKGSDWTGANEKRLLNRDTPTLGFVRNGTISGFIRDGSNGPNLLPSPGYFFRDIWYDRSIAPYPGTANFSAFYDYGTTFNMLCGYVDYTGNEEFYDYSQTPGDSPSSSPYANSVFAGTDICLLGPVPFSAGRGYKFFDEVWRRRTLSSPPKIENFGDSFAESDYNLFAFLVEKDGSSPIEELAEGIFNMRLSDINLKIPGGGIGANNNPGVYPWSRE